MPLTLALSGQHVVKKIAGKDEVRKFLNSLGFIEGSVVSVVSENGGNLIVNVKDSRVAIDRSMASRILV